MIKTIPILILMCFSLCCLGQAKYKTCTVYCENHMDAKRSGLALRQLFNAKGKIIYEKEYGRYAYSDTGYFYNDTTQIVRETYYYYKNDTLLSKEMSLKESRSAVSKSGIDTFLTLHYYNNQNHLVRTVSTYYGSHGFSCLDNGTMHETRWGDSTKTIYQYDNVGNIIEKYRVELDAEERGLTNEVPNRQLYHYNNGQLSEIGNYIVFGLKLISEDNGIKEYYTPASPGDSFLLSREIYTYKKGLKNNQIRVHKISVEEFEQEMTDYSLDEQNRIEEEDVFGDCMYHLKTTKYFYNPEKRIREELTYNPDQKIKETKTYTYQ